MLARLMALLASLPWFAQVFLLIWIVVMIAVPILKWRWGAGAERVGIVLGVLFQAATVLAILVPAWGFAATLRMAFIVIGMGWSVEYVGSHTGWPFGRYHYTPRLQPQVGGVPLLIPLAWLMMLPPAWAVAQSIAQGPAPIFIAVAALAFTAWDLFLDPQMVAWGFWTWERPGGYFGIPWLNYGGWLLASAVITAVVAPAPLPVAPLCLVYGITWGLQTFGQLFFWKLRGPALVGFFAMGMWVVWALLV